MEREKLWVEKKMRCPSVHFPYENITLLSDLEVENLITVRMMIKYSSGIFVNLKIVIHFIVLLVVSCR